MAKEIIQGIVISNIKHTDRNSIVTLFTRNRGRVSFVCAMGTGKTGRARKAALLPMNIVEAVVNFKECKDLQTLNGVTTLEPLHDLYYNPYKSSILIFLSEFLNRFLRESPPDTELWDYVRRSMRFLNSTERGIANFHLMFLLNVISHAGVLPEVSNGESGWFDMRSGMVTSIIPGHKDYLTPAQYDVFKNMLRISERNLHYFKFSREERNQVVTLLIRYLSIHFPGFSTIKSLEVLRDLFS